MAVTVDGAEAATATATAGRPWELDGCRLGFFSALVRSGPSPPLPSPTVPEPSISDGSMPLWRTGKRTGGPAGGARRLCFGVAKCP
jgi:hypothetical protein